MIVLLASLTLAVTPPSSPTLQVLDAGLFAPCRTGVTRLTYDGKAAQFVRLGNLPDAHMELPVVRIVRQDHACRSAPLIVRYEVSR